MTQIFLYKMGVYLFLYFFKKTKFLSKDGQIRLRWLRLGLNFRAVLPSLKTPNRGHYPARKFSPTNNCVLGKCPTQTPLCKSTARWYVNAIKVSFTSG